MILFEIDEELLELVDEIADKQGESRSSFIKKAVQKEMESRYRCPKCQEKNMLEILGRNYSYFFCPFCGFMMVREVTK
ncbi:MAG: ribbon-helix-helix protein, CopG family [Candidatus Bathyarchaeia archaeon]